MAQAADIVVLVLGNDKPQEHEGIDRPRGDGASQRRRREQQGRQRHPGGSGHGPGGGALAIDHILDGSLPGKDDTFPPPGGIVEAFNPSFQAEALAAALFGDENRWGKLPVTMYPHTFTSENPM